MLDIENGTFKIPMWDEDTKSIEHSLGIVFFDLSNVSMCVDPHNPLES